MPIKLGTTSLARLATCHPDIQRVIKRAALIAEPADDFTVLEGVRSREQMMINYGKGRTVAQCAAKGIPAGYAKPGVAKVTWLNNPFASPHAKQADGTSHAIDLAPWPIDWNDIARFDRMAHIVLEAAKLESVALTWGADWDRDGKPRERGESDSPHFQLAH